MAFRTHPGAAGRTRPTTFLRLLLPLVLAPGGPAAAQPSGPEGVAVPGKRYEAGRLHRWVFGSNHREVWTEPVRMEVLDLGSYGGGLRPLRVGGGRQTRSLRLAGANGREYVFRPVDKDPSAVLDTILQGTVVSDIVQDGISAAHPYGAMVAAPILQAAGVLHASPELRLMPDDPALGRFRDEFAGVVGLIEEWPDENDHHAASFGGARRVISSDRLSERLRRGSSDRVDARAFLRARLVDLLLGDWDRHRGQWRWASYGGEEPRIWRPIPRDRDQVFSHYGGAATRVLSLYMPMFPRFQEEYPAIERLTWNSREIDRWFLAGLDSATWESVGQSVQDAITDSVITAAVERLPEEIHEMIGAELSRVLGVRRDRLKEAWRDFYRLLSTEVEVRATDAAEWVVIDRERNGVTRVAIAAAPDAAPHFVRDFRWPETAEVRIRLLGGDDIVTIRGEAESSILLRLIGGDDDDLFVFEDGVDDVRVYDHHGENAWIAEETPSFSREPYEEWAWTEENRSQPRDWGRRTFPVVWSSFSTDVGPFIGGGIRRETYGFRRRPFATRLVLRAGYAPVVGKGRLDVDLQVNGEHSSWFSVLGAHLSQLETQHYFGLGNQTEGGSRDYHRVDLTSASFRVGLGWSPSPRTTGRLTVRFDRSRTGVRDGSFFEGLGPVYGSGTFQEVGVEADLALDPLVERRATGNRFRVEVRGAVYPSVLDVRRAYARVGGLVSGLLASSARPAVSAAVRMGGERVFGTFPWHRAAFLGGGSTLTGFTEQRFAGDASLYAGTEVRLRLVRPVLVVPSALGVFGLVEAGRVFVGGASPGGWRRTLGGGLYLQPVRQPYLLRLGAAWGEESIRAFVGLGLPY